MPFLGKEGGRERQTDRQRQILTETKSEADNTTEHPANRKRQTMCQTQFTIHYNQTLREHKEFQIGTSTRPIAVNYTERKSRVFRKRNKETYR